MNASELRGLAPDKQLNNLAEFTAFSSVITGDAGTTPFYTLYYNKV